MESPVSSSIKSEFMMLTKGVNRESHIVITLLTCSRIYGSATYLHTCRYLLAGLFRFSYYRLSGGRKGHIEPCSRNSYACLHVFYPGSSSWLEINAYRVPRRGQVKVRP